MRWKPLKWWLIGLIALLWAIWASGGYLPVQASPVEQDMFKIGGDLVVAEAQTVRDAFAIGGDVTIRTGASVQGDAFAIGGNLRLEDDVHVDGDAFAIGGQLIRADSAVVTGSEFTLMEQFSGVFERFGVFGTLYLVNIAFWLVSFAIATIAGLLLLLLMPGHIDAIATTVHARPFMSLMYGLGGIAALIVLSVITSGSVLGAIVLPLAHLAFLLTGLFGGAAICLWLGRRLRQQKANARFQHFWLGLIVLLIISWIPMAGGLLVSFVTLFGFGATLLARYGTQAATDLPVSLDRLEHQPE